MPRSDANHLQPTQPDEFYVGYEPIAPPGIVRRTRVFIGAYVVLSMIIATACIVLFARTGRGTWNDGSFRQFTGVLIPHPYPVLLLDQPLEDCPSRTAILVDFGKRGVQTRAAKIGAGRVTVSGTVLHRDGRAMIELAPGDDSLVRSALQKVALPQPGTANQYAVPPGFTVTLRGEIVDPKCFLGAMKPGEGKTHKACAVRCISGGIPPALVTWDAKGNSSFYLLTDEFGEPANALFLDFVGEPVELSGTLSSLGELYVVRVRRADIQKL